MSTEIESYEAELRGADTNPVLLTMCARGVIAHAKMLEAERDDLRKRLARAVSILAARHTGEGAVHATEETRRAALEFIENEYNMELCCDGLT